MHEVALPERARARVADAPRHARARGRVMLAVDDVADAADRHAQCETGDAAIEDVRDRELASARHRKATDDAAHDAAGHRRTAVPHGDDLLGVRRVVRPRVDDVEHTRADEAAEDARDRDGVRVGIPHSGEVDRGRSTSPSEQYQSHAKRGAREDAEQREHAVPGDVKGTE